MARIDRRRFFAASAGGVGALLGCDGVAPQGAAGDQGPWVGAGSGGLDGSAASEMIDAGGVPVSPTCGELTESNIEGPFFTVNSPERSNLQEPGMAGVRLVITGRVQGALCTPLGGAMLDFWQANDAGAYDTQGYILRGHQFADAQGRYRLETIIPGRYLNGATYRPAHIHVKVRGVGTALLTTQLYFAGDPYNAMDPFIADSLIMDVVAAESRSVASVFDFVIA